MQDVSVLVTSASSEGLELPGPLGLHIKSMSVCEGEFFTYSLAQWRSAHYSVYTHVRNKNSNTQRSSSIYTF